MGKKFMGLGGTDHFWDRAKAWILNQITSAVATKIAEVVADAPEDLDTLKEIADWIKTHANDAAAMNTQITENKSNIAANSSSISAMNTQITENKNNIAANSSSISAMNTAILANTEAISGKADKSHTHTKSEITDFPTSLKNPNALTVNGKTYNGSEAVDAGVQTIANGGTGATDAASGFNTLADGVRDSSTPKDDEKMLLKPAGTWYKTTCLDFWNYIKGKISSVLGLTKDNYGGKASTAGTADVLVNGSGKLKFFYAYSNNSKKLLKLGTFGNGTEASFLLTVKRTDGLGFTGHLTINSNSEYSTNIKQFNGYKSSYSIYGITNGELVFLYRNDNNTNDVYIWCPSYGVVSIILMCGKNPWGGGMDTDVTLTEVSGFSGTLLDKF